MAFEELEDLFHSVEEDVATLVADVHDLALYTKLNITGFLKILKVSVNVDLLPTSSRHFRNMMSVQRVGASLGC